MQGQYSLRSPAVKRLMKEAQELSEPTEQFYAQPLEDNLFEWHFSIRGPEDSEFSGGLYHGRILLPPDYPMKPPSIILLTPNGRFEVFKKICLSISGHHPESWQPSWSIRTALLAIIGFMPTHGNGAIGSLDYTADERKRLAKKSQDYKCPQCGSIKNLLKPVTEASKATSLEAKELASQIDFKGEKEKEASSDANSQESATNDPEPESSSASASSTPSPPSQSSPPSTAASTIPNLPPFPPFNPAIFTGRIPTTSSSSPPNLPQMPLPPFMHPMFTNPMMRPGQPQQSTSSAPPLIWPPPGMRFPTTLPPWLPPGANPASRTSSSSQNGTSPAVSASSGSTSTSQSTSPPSRSTPSTASTPSTSSVAGSTVTPSSSSTDTQPSSSPTFPSTSSATATTSTASNPTELRQRHVQPTTSSRISTPVNQPAELPAEANRSRGTTTAVLLVVVGLAIALLLFRRLYYMNLIIINYGPNA